MWARGVLAAGLCALLLAPALARELRLDIGRVAHPAFLLDGVQLVLGVGEGAAGLQVADIRVGERRFGPVRLDCPQFSFDARRLRCAGGSLNMAGLPGLGVELEADLQQGSGRLRLSFAPDEAVQFSLASSGRLRVELHNLDLGRVQHAMPAIADWQPLGRLNGWLAHQGALDEGSTQLELVLSEGGFASSDGLQAAEAVQAKIRATAGVRAGVWRWQAEVDWLSGEAYMHPLYLQAGPALRAEGEFHDGLLRIASAQLKVEGVDAIALRADYDLRTARLRSAGLVLAQADLALVGPRYLAPWLMPAQTERLRFAGHASAGIEWTEAGLHAADVVLSSAGFSLADDILAFGPVSGHLPWRVGGVSDVRFVIEGGHWQALRLGAFDLHAQLEGARLIVPSLRVPVLDGAVVLDSLTLQRGQEGWHGRGAAIVEPVSMSQLSVALGLPEMSGVLSAALPGVRLAPGEIVLDGALVASIFGGWLRVDHLRVLEPFGVASHLRAEIEASHLDLARITDTFSFGSISGQIDASIRALELVRWRPVRFDARIASSSGSYPRRISQRAVQNIGALGGAGAMAAVQRSLLGFFDSFGYREIGLSCVLEGGVCQMGGLEERGDQESYVIVRGGGIPALNVIGYNRRVDWPVLLDRLQRVIESNSAPVVQ